MKSDLLLRARTPDELKLLPVSELPDLAEEIRSFLVEHVMETGGHLASNLGVVELTLALLRMFDPLKDHILFDVGHQAYVYKMLTGRKDRFDTLRKPGGLSGFIKRSESEYDAFGAGHSSTSLSAALGFARAERIRGSDAYTVAVIGDGAYTGGMIHEALNNCEKGLRLIIILNENEMSISKNIGSFATYLAGVRQSKRYRNAKKNTRNLLSHLPLVGKPLLNGMTRFKKRWKNRLYGSNYFEDLGLYYIGPADGNDEQTVESMLKVAMEQNESALIHLKTQKGKGYAPAEENPGAFHCIPQKSDAKAGETMPTELGRILTDMAEQDPTVCAVTAAMTDGTGLRPFRESFPERFFDVGIAEEHALTFSAGLAANGMKPFFAVYSSFLQRGYDNLIHDIALQDLPVTVCIDRIGLNSSDGATHHGIFDVSFLSSIPRIEILAPADSVSLRKALLYASGSNHPTAIRYPHGTGISAKDLARFRIVSCNLPGEILPARITGEPNENYDAMIVSYGSLITEALHACDILAEEGIRCGVILLEQLKPYRIPASQIQTLISDSVRYLLISEEGTFNGGAAMILSSLLPEEHHISCPIGICAIRDSFIETVKEGQSLLDAAGISAKCQADRIRSSLKK